MAEGISRQVERAQLILDVLQEDEWLTSAEIGSMFGLGRQAITPYIQALRDMGHDIESAKGKGHRMRERLTTGQLNLSQEELYALFLSFSRSLGPPPTFRPKWSLESRIAYWVCFPSRENSKSKSCE